MKQKTINYLHNSVDKVEALFGKAVEYRTKFDRATSSVAKEIYRKKLKKTIKQMEPYMGLFGEIQKMREAKEEALALETKDADEAKVEE